MFLEEGFKFPKLDPVLIGRYSKTAFQFSDLFFNLVGCVCDTVCCVLCKTKLYQIIVPAMYLLSYCFDLKCHLGQLHQQVFSNAALTW